MWIESAFKIMQIYLITKSAKTQVKNFIHTKKQ